jgi:hypothetical protein
MRVYLLGIAALLGLAVPANANAQTPCLVQDSITAAVRAKLIVLATSSDTEVVNGRANLNLPSVDSSAVQVVADSTTCAGVAATLATLTPGGDPQPAAWVFTFGPTRYIAYNFRQRLHGSAYIYVFDQYFAKLSSWMF